jgi:excisionase family DNA binding protein
MNTIDEAKFLSVAQAASIVGLSQKTIRNLMERGEIPYVRIGNSIRIPLRWRDELLRATKGEHASEGSAEA